MFPSNFMLAAAMNPCPCGNFPDFSRCSCTPWQMQQYLSRVSQPFLDRIDICMEVPRIQYEEIRENIRQETSADIRKRVEAARNIQQKRYEGTGVWSNSMLSVGQIEKFCCLGSGEEELMKQAFTALSLTARTYHKILKVARTIADMEGGGEIGMPHLKEAIGYRTVDKKYWGR